MPRDAYPFTHDHTKYKVGDRLCVLDKRRVAWWNVGDVVTVTGYKSTINGRMLRVSSRRSGGNNLLLKNYKLGRVNKEQPTEDNMSESNSVEIKKVVSDVFTKTADAILVQKHLGGQMRNTFIGTLEVYANKEEILKEAKRLEKLATKE